MLLDRLETLSEAMQRAIWLTEEEMGSRRPSGV